MRLKTSHNSYVFAGQAGELLHGPGPIAHCGLRLPRRARAPVRAPGEREITVAKGPLAPSTLVVLEGGRVAFRRDGLYLCANPSIAELAFNRAQVGPWEQFTIEATGASPAGVRLPYIPKSFIPPLSGTAADFRRRARAKFAVTEEEDIHLPTTVSDEQLATFESCVDVNLPPALRPRGLSKCSMIKLPSKYLNLSDSACGVVFDRDRFWTDPVSLSAGALPDYMVRDGADYRLDFGYLANLPEENASTFIFYDSNYSNYFHWWAECLANIELATTCLGSVPPMIIWNGRPKLSDWQRASLDILGVEVIHRTTQGSRVVRVKEAVWFYRESGSAPGRLLRGLRARALKAIATPGPMGKKLYIKRKANRYVKNDDDIELMLSQLGYEIICAEDFSQREQIEIFSAARAVIAIHGAGLTNMLFMPPGATVIELTPHVEVRPFYWIMAEKLRHRYGVLMCAAVDGRFDGGIHVDLADLSRLIAMMEADAASSGQLGGVGADLGGGAPL